jgi:hypothetical protein
MIAAPARAQQVTGNIAGRVLDVTKAPIPGAEVAIMRAETGEVREATTDQGGVFSFPSLQIGAYQVSVAHTGFKKAVRTGIDLHVGDHLEIDIVLELGAVSQQVDVVGDAPAVQVDTSEQGGLISGEQVRNLQLNGRNFMTLVELLPGVVSDLPDRIDPYTGAALYVNGARSSGNGFSIDGANNSAMIGGGSNTITFTGIDTIAEFKVITSTFSAEYGRSGTSQVNVVTRGGTRDLHGALFEYFRNDKMDATDYFSHNILPLRQNQFGYTLGGPVLLPKLGYNRDRKKTFFFFGQEFNYVNARSAALNTTVPTPAEAAGDFSGRGPGNDRIFGTADDPVVDPLTKVGFPNGKIPAERMDSNAVKLIKLYPAPNFTGPGAINYTSAVPGRQRWHEEMIRLDQNFSPKWKMYGRYTQNAAPVRNPYGGWQYNTTTNTLPYMGATKSSPGGQSAFVNVTNVFSQHLLHEFSLNFESRVLNADPDDNVPTRTQLGIRIPEVFPENVDDVIPVVSLGSPYPNINVPRYYLKQFFNLEFSDTWTKLAGRHQLKAGAYYAYGGNRENPGLSALTSGYFAFNLSSTMNSKVELANMLLGYPSQYMEDETSVVARTRFATLEGFLQDDFKATSRLTLNVGLRWSNYFNPWDAKNVATNFMPSLYNPAKALQIDAATGSIVPGTGDPLNGIIIAGKNSPWGKNVTQNNRNLVGPRFGFAFMPFRGTKKFAMRGGYGIYFNQPMIGSFVNSSQNNPPFNHRVTFYNMPFSDPTAGKEGAQPPSALTALGLPMLAPTIQQWSCGVDQELPGHWALRVSYVGSHGTHLMRPIRTNDPRPGKFVSGKLHYNYLRPYTGWATIDTRQTSASSIYHSAQLTLNRRFAKMVAGITYTFSKSIDDGSTERNAADFPPDSSDARMERAVSNFDRTHVFTANYIYPIRDAVRSGSLFAPLLNGWQISGITRLYSGMPFSVVMNYDVAQVGVGANQRPNLIGDVKGPRTTGQWFNIYAFGRPATGMFGNLGRNTLRRPGVNKWDLAIFKTFRIREGKTMQYRAEAFNMPNHPSFGAPGATLSTSATAVNPAANNFGVITSTRDARVMQMSLRLSF